MTDLVMVDGAQYRDRNTGELYIFLGHKQKGRIVLRSEQDEGLVSIVIYDDVKDTLEDTGVHDHEGYCCTVHNTHSSPHKGCILR